MSEIRVDRIVDSTGNSPVIYLDPSANEVRIGTGITFNTITNQIILGDTVVGDISGNANFSGIVTALAFVGDGSGLTNLPSGGGGGTSDWMRTDAGIHTLGNVGVGTTNPQVRLQIDGVLGFGTFDNSGQSATNIRIGDVTTGSNLTDVTYNNIFMGIGAGAGSYGAIKTIGITTFTTLIGEADNGYTVSATGGNGSDAIFDVSRDENGGVSEIIINDLGQSYEVGDILTIDGSDVGGSSGTDDIVITVNEVIGDTGLNEGSHNNFFGYKSGEFNYSGSYNNFFGRLVGQYNLSGSNNNFFGDSAGRFNNSGGNNNFFGFEAGYRNIDGSNNNFFGVSAGYYNTSGFDNNFLGNSAGYYNTSGDTNNFIGPSAGYQNTTGSYNNFFGSDAGRYNTTGFNNNFFGSDAGHNNTIGDNNNFIGSYVGFNNTSGSKNNFIGYGAGENNDSGSNNNFLGYGAGKGIYARISFVGITTYTTLVGEADNTYSGISATGGSGSGAIFEVSRDSNGDVSDVTITYGGQEYQVGDTLTIDGSDVGGSSGTDDIVISVDVIEGSIGSNNNFFGYYAGFKNATGSRNNFFGLNAGRLNHTGSYNNFFGDNAGRGVNILGEINSGSYNNFIGYHAGKYNQSGSHNNFFGDYAGSNNNSGSYNNFLGRFAGSGNTFGSHNNFFGTSVGLSTSASYKVIIGSGNNFNIFDSPDEEKDTQLAVGIRTSSAPANYWIVGDENFNVGIGTATVLEKLSVGGNIDLNHNVVYGSIREASFTLNPTVIHSGLSTSVYRSVEYTIQATNQSNYQVIKILALHDGLVGYSTTISNLYNNTEVATFNVVLGSIQTIGITTYTTLIGEADNGYTVSATGGSGSGAIFEVSRDSNGDVSDVTITYGGQEYQVGDTLTIDGSDVGGSSGTDDIVISVDSINQNITLISTASTDASITDYTINFTATKSYISPINE